MEDNFIRTFARRILGFVVRVCPGETREWGAAMMAELNYVRGPLAAVRWAAGCAATLLRHSAVELVRRAINKPPTVEILPVALEGRMKKSTIIFILVFTAASFLFVLTPGFRHALQLSETTWRTVLFPQAGESDVSPRLLAQIEKQARKTHDAQALAFAALHDSDLPKSGMLAEQAVEWDPQLRWIYAGLVQRRFGTLIADRWIRSLQKWDPDNAVPYLLEARTIRWKEEAKNNWRPDQTSLPDLPGWVAAMRKAFAAEKYNCYLPSMISLDRTVLARFHVWNPYAVLDDVASSYFVRYSDIKAYADAFPLREGQDLESKGEFPAAEQRYWSVVRFGHLLELQGETNADHFAATNLEYEAYQRLLPLAEKQKGLTEASLLRFEIARLEQSLGMPSNGHARSGWGGNLNQRRALLWMTRGMGGEAATVQISTLLFLISGLVLLVLCLYAFTNRPRRQDRTGSPNSAVSTIGIVSATCLFLSSVSLYLSFRPYHDLFNHFMAGGSARSLATFASFGITTREFLPAYNLRVYFWYAVIGVGVIALLLVLARHLRHSPGPQAFNAQ